MFHVKQFNRSGSVNFRETALPNGVLLRSNYIRREAFFLSAQGMKLLSAVSSLSFRGILKAGYI